MSEKIDDPGTRVLKTLHQIVDLCGPRPAGSYAEEKLKEYIIEQLSSKKYSIQRSNVRFSQFPAILSQQSSQAITLTILTIAAFRFPVIGLLIPVGLTAIPGLVFQLIRYLPHQMNTENVLALNQNTSLSDIKLLLIAHMDTARAQRVEDRLIRLLLGSFFYAGYLVAIASFIRLMQFEISWIMLMILVGLPLFYAIVIIIYTLFYKYPKESGYSSGANDNASGVAVLLELAMDDDFTNLPIGYLFTSAEEEGLYGAAAFVKQINGD